MGTITVEEAVKEIRRRSMKLISAVPKPAPLADQGYTVTSAAVSYPSQPPVPGSWLSSIDMSPDISCPGKSSFKLLILKDGFDDHNFVTNT